MVLKRKRGPGPAAARVKREAATMLKDFILDYELWDAIRREVKMEI
jgi:hypothetical protein